MGTPVVGDLLGPVLGSQLVNIGAAGHINVDSGHGPWPRGLALFKALQAAQGDLPLGTIPCCSRRSDSFPLPRREMA